VYGRIDRKDPNRVSGSTAEDYRYTEHVYGKTVVTWSLSN
jgi:hypothetical protein